jgi:hypothetical protein
MQVENIVLYEGEVEAFGPSMLEPLCERVVQRCHELRLAENNIQLVTLTFSRREPPTDRVNGPEDLVSATILYEKDR